MSENRAIDDFRLTNVRNYITQGGPNRESEREIFLTEIKKLACRDTLKSIAQSNDTRLQLCAEETWGFKPFTSLNNSQVLVPIRQKLKEFYKQCGEVNKLGQTQGFRGIIHAYYDSLGEVGEPGSISDDNLILNEDYLFFPDWKEGESVITRTDTVKKILERKASSSVQLAEALKGLDEGFWQGFIEALDKRDDIRRELISTIEDNSIHAITLYPKPLNVDGHNALKILLHHRTASSFATEDEYLQATEKLLYLPSSNSTYQNFHTAVDNLSVAKGKKTRANPRIS